MPHFKHTDRDQGLLIPVSLTEQILPGTFEYTIDYIVDEKIDTTYLETKYKNDETGASAYSPKVLLKIILLAYSRGTISSRKIQPLCEENIVFMALTGGLAPDFTTIAGFIREMKDDIEKIFQDVLLICSELNLLGGTEFALDGCKISSNASKEWSGTFSDLEKKKEKLRNTVLFLIKKHKKNDKKENGLEENNKRKKQIEKIESKIRKIDEFLRSNDSKTKSQKPSWRKTK